MRRVIIIVLVLLPLAVLAVWIGVRAHRLRPKSAIPAGTSATAPGPQLPSPSSCGAAGRSQLEHYDRSTVYDWLDGGAAPYLDHGFTTSTVATYRFETGGRTLTIEAAAVRFASPRGAAAQAAAETPPGAAPVPGLPGAHSTRDVLVWCRGRDMLRLVSFTPGAETSGPFAALARAWLGGTAP
ncbi:MAG: hypothetical protein GXP48_04805 [Acidobacteria bacterium]|nr:hypothetical protein [Acidobacteriota bacterium]